MIAKISFFFNIANNYSATFRKIIPQLSGDLFRNFSLLHCLFFLP